MDVSFDYDVPFIHSVEVLDPGYNLDTLPTSSQNMAGEDIFLRVNGSNFGSATAERSIRISRVPEYAKPEDHVWQGFNINEFTETGHTSLVFKLKEGEGSDLRLLLRIQGQEPSNNFMPHSSLFDGSRLPTLLVDGNKWPSRLHSDGSVIQTKAFVRGSARTGASRHATAPSSMFAAADKDGNKALTRAEFEWACTYIPENDITEIVLSSAEDRGEGSAEDSDYDSLPDKWELANGLDPSSGRDANADTDGDGHTNLQDYIRGSCWDEQTRWNGALDFNSLDADNNDNISQDELLRAFDERTVLADQENIRISYGTPRIDKIKPSGLMREQKNDGYLWPTSGCAKFASGEYADNGKARCERLAYFTITGENFGLTQPLIVVKDEEEKTLFSRVFPCTRVESGESVSIPNCESQRSHHVLVVELPQGVGIATVEVRARDVNTPYFGPSNDYVLSQPFDSLDRRRRLATVNHDDQVSMFTRVSNFLRFKYSAPDILDTRFGPDIDSASQSGVIGAIGSVKMGEALGIPHRFYLLGQNFGETASLVSELRPLANARGVDMVIPLSRRTLVTELGKVLDKNGDDFKCKRRPQPEPTDMEWEKCKKEGTWQETDCFTIYRHTTRSDSVWETARSSEPYCPKHFIDAAGVLHPYKCYGADPNTQNGVCKMEDDRAVNVTFVSRDTKKPTPCLDAKWHPHTIHPWRYTGQPLLSCIAPPTTVGRKDIRIIVATKERQMEIPLDSRCFEGYYGQIGEFCVECWNYLTRHPNIPDTTEQVFAAKCHATYDKDLGTSEPVSERGFAVLPPPMCQSGECKRDQYRDSGEYAEDPYFSDNYDAIPPVCLAKSPDADEQGVVPLLHDCAKGASPGIYCHPARVNGTIELAGGDMESLTAARSICPYIMPCEPPESCLSDGQCNHKDGYVSYYKPYFESFSEDGEKEMHCNAMHYRMPREVRGSNRDRQLFSVNIDMGIGDDELVMPCKFADCSDGTAVDYNDQVQCDLGNRSVPLEYKRSNAELAILYDQLETLKKDSKEMWEEWKGNKTKWHDGRNVSQGLEDFFVSYAVTSKHLNDDGVFENSCSQYKEDAFTDMEQYKFWWACLVHQAKACERNERVRAECLKTRDEPRFWRTGCMCYAPRCSQCNPGTHFRLDGVCEACPDQPWLIPLMMLAGAIFGTMAMRLMTKFSVNMTIINIGIDYFQVLSLFSRSKAQWPDDLKLVIKFFAIFQFDIDLAAPECLPSTGAICEVPIIGAFCKLKGWINFERKWFMKVSLPFIGGGFVAIAMMYLGMKRWIKRCRQAKHLTKQEVRAIRVKELPLCTQVVSMINTLIYFLYLGICRAALSIFNCIDTKPITGRKYLAAEPMQECYIPGGVQQRLHPWAIGVLCLYCIGFPAYIATLFRMKREKIIADQTMRAHGRGDDPSVNKNYGVRKMFGKLYYPYRPTKYWWALIIIWKKFFVVLFGIMFRDFPTFQMAITLFVVFLAFSAHVDNDPFMGMIEKAEIIRTEAEETILREIKKLERAQLLVRINGKAYYQLMHSMRVQIDEQEAIMSKHHNSPFNYNTIESVFLMTSCVVVLAGIMFDSDWILERIVVPEYEIRGKVISYPRHVPGDILRRILRRRIHSRMPRGGEAAANKPSAHVGTRESEHFQNSWHGCQKYSGRA